MLLSGHNGKLVRNLAPVFKKPVYFLKPLFHFFFPCPQRIIRRICSSKRPIISLSVNSLQQENYDYMEPMTPPLAEARRLNSTFAAIRRMVLIFILFSLIFICTLIRYCAFCAVLTLLHFLSTAVHSIMLCTVFVN